MNTPPEGEAPLFVAERLAVDRLIGFDAVPMPFSALRLTKPPAPLFASMSVFALELRIAPFAAATEIVLPEPETMPLPVCEKLTLPLAVLSVTLPGAVSVLAREMKPVVDEVLPACSVSVPPAAMFENGEAVTTVMLPACAAPPITTLAA